MQRLVADELRASVGVRELALSESASEKLRAARVIRTTRSEIDRHAEAACVQVDALSTGSIPSDGTSRYHLDVPDAKSETKPDGPAFRARIKKLREGRDWSQREIDRRAGWGDDSGQYSRIERGKRGGRPTVTMIATLARVFNVRERFLLWGEEPGPVQAESESPFERAAQRARAENVHKDAIEGVRNFPNAPLNDETKLYELMVFAHHQLMRNMEDKRAATLLPKLQKKKKAAESAPASSKPKSKRETGTE